VAAAAFPPQSKTRLKWRAQPAAMTATVKFKSGINVENLAPLEVNIFSCNLSLLLLL
jgi:hypothetical protein